MFLGDQASSTGRQFAISDLSFCRGISNVAVNLQHWSQWIDLQINAVASF